MDAGSAWQLVFQKLALQDVVKCGRVCTQLHRAACDWLALRKKDAASGSERCSVPYYNEINNVVCADIKYVRENVLSSGAPVREAYAAIRASGCNCCNEVADEALKPAPRPPTLARGSLFEARTASERGLSKQSAEAEEEFVQITEKSSEKGSQLSKGGALAASSCSKEVDEQQYLAERLSASSCAVSSCRCGKDLSNEAAYNEARLLSALLEHRELEQHGPFVVSGPSMACQETLTRVRTEAVCQWPNKRKLHRHPIVSREPPKKHRYTSITTTEADSDTYSRQTAGNQLQRSRLRWTKDNPDSESGLGTCSLVDHNKQANSSLMVFECGPACSCSIECVNRCTQRGLSARVKVVRHRQKGWCLIAAEVIQRGAFVCQYAGELLTNSEAEKRHALYDTKEYHSSSLPPPALLVVREHLPSGTTTLRLNIDATNFGNVARFINHSCDGGNVARVLVRQAGWPLPHVALFASRMVLPGDEITMSYGDVLKNSLDQESAPPCFCGSSNCIGVMPRDLFGT